MTTKENLIHEKDQKNINQPTSHSKTESISEREMSKTKRKQSLFSKEEGQTRGKHRMLFNKSIQRTKHGLGK